MRLRPRQDFSNQVAVIETFCLTDHHQLNSRESPGGIQLKDVHLALVIHLDVDRAPHRGSPSHNVRRRPPNAVLLRRSADTDTQRTFPIPASLEIVQAIFREI